MLVSPSDFSPSPSSNSSQSTRPIERVLWEELLVLSRFHSLLPAEEWNFCLVIIIYSYESTLTTVRNYIIGSLNFLTCLIVFTFSVNLFQRKWTFAFGKFPKWLICSLRSTYSRFYNWNVYWIKLRVTFVVPFTEPSSLFAW